MPHDAHRATTESPRTTRRLVSGLIIVTLLIVAARADSHWSTQPNAPVQLALETLIGLDALSVGYGDDSSIELAARCLKKANTVAIILAALDANADGAVSLQEVFAADLLAVARRVEAQLRCQAPAVTISADDGPLRDAASRYLNAVMASSEVSPLLSDEPPPLPIATLRGRPNDLLRLAALRALADRVAALGTRPEEGHMTGRDTDANEAEKAALLARLDRMFELADLGQLRPLRSELFALRLLTDGLPRVPDVIAPSAAPRVLAHVDRLLDFHYY
jgi:hypothetical protein